MLLWMLCHDTTMKLPPDWCLASTFTPFNPLKMCWGWPENDPYLHDVLAAWTLDWNHEWSILLGLSIEGSMAIT